MQPQSTAAEQRAMASLAGLAMGDSFGERFFFPSVDAESRIAQRTLAAPPWRYTDDTAQAAVLTRHLIERHEVHQSELAAQLAEEYMFDCRRGYGVNAHDILAQIADGKDWKALSHGSFNGTGSMGNGAAMRAAPLGAYFASDLQVVASQAARSAEVTHANANGIAGAEAVAVAAAVVATGATDPDFIWNQVLTYTRASMTRDYCEIASRIPAGTSAENVAGRVGNGSRVCAHDTVPFALWAAIQFLGQFEEAMWFTVSALGDRDTTCAIAGGVLCADVNTSLPDAWRSYWEGLP